jgi:class 3 adenylate cyclase
MPAAARPSTPGARSLTTTAEHAAAQVLPATADATAERRLVSVLFADLVGFTAFSEGRDAEEVRDLQTHYFETVSETIGRYGGTIEKFIGDAVMALWGACPRGARPRRRRPRPGTGHRDPGRHRNRRSSG